MVRLLILNNEDVVRRVFFGNKEELPKLLAKLITKQVIVQVVEDEIIKLSREQNKGKAIIKKNDTVYEEITIEELSKVLYEVLKSTDFAPIPIRGKISLENPN